MSVFHNNALIGSGGGAAAAAAAGPTRSLRFNDDDSAYLNRNTSSSGNRRTWTWSCWLKRSGLAVRQEILLQAVMELTFSLRATTNYNFIIIPVLIKAGVKQIAYLEIPPPGITLF